MRLIDKRTLQLVEFDDCDEVDYAILSHRWEEEETSFQEFVANPWGDKKGLKKIQECCNVAWVNEYSYVWIDTCCIDKSSSAELSEAINSMYRWYERSRMCYVYLSDVETAKDLAKSLWFTRGWTLQELIAPEDVTFYNRWWQPIGNKWQLVETLAAITKIPRRVLGRDLPLDECSVAQRFAWIANRTTRRKEDMAYSLLGLFGVNIPMLYGEGTRAFLRLQQEIIRQTSDMSIFAWRQSDRTHSHDSYRSILAPSPICFLGFAEQRWKPDGRLIEYSLSNLGLSITLEIRPCAMNTYVASLGHGAAFWRPLLKLGKEKWPPANRHFFQMYIQLAYLDDNRHFVRVATLEGDNSDGEDGEIPHVAFAAIEESQWPRRDAKVIILNPPIRERLSWGIYGFTITYLTDSVFPWRMSRQEDQSGTPWVYDFERLRIRGPGRRRERGRVNLLEHPELRAPGAGALPPFSVELSPGQSGAVAELVPDAPVHRGQEGPHRTRAGSTAAGSSFFLGFDFDFNPVCLLCKGDRPDLSVFEPPGWIRNGQQSDKAKSSEDSWQFEGFCFLQGIRAEGLDEHLPFLDLKIREGYPQYSLCFCVPC